MRRAILCFIAVLPLAAQEIKLPPNLDKLAERATEVVDVNLDGPMLQLAARFLSDKDSDEARVKKMIGGLKSVYVKSFQFDTRGEYQDSDIESFRSQFRAPVWSRIVGVRSRRGGDNADVILRSDGSQITGLVIIVTEPRELTIVSINGAINPDDIRDLGGHFGIPKLDVTRKDKPAKDE
jgi:Domain of unknown function (DUF4252)